MQQIYWVAELGFKPRQSESGDHILNKFFSFLVYNLYNKLYKEKKIRTCYNDEYNNIENDFRFL